MLQSRDRHVRLFHFVCSLFVNNSFRLFVKTKFNLSQNYQSFYIYFVRFLTERSFNKIIRSKKTTVFFKNISKNRFIHKKTKKFIPKIVRSLKKRPFFTNLLKNLFVKTIFFHFSDRLISFFHRSFFFHEKFCSLKKRWSSLLQSSGFIKMKSFTYSTKWFAKHWSFNFVTLCKRI